jgi:acetyl esterase
MMKLSRDALRRIAGKPVVVEGQTLDVQIQMMLDGMRRLGVVQSDDVETARKWMDQDGEAVAPEPPAMASERDVVIRDSLRARVYEPTTARDGAGMLVYLHGGGFVLGSIASHEAPVKMLAHESGVIVASIEYGLGPEQMFPAAVDDAMAAYAWARERASRVGVGGDSAGGNLSAVVCNLAKQRKMPQPTHQLLIYPAIDWWRTSQSHETFATGYFLDESRTFWYEHRYLSTLEERDDPRASPVRFGDFGGLAPATIVTAGFDILRDEGAQYAEALARAGVPVDYACERSLIHGFFNMGGAIDAARAANTRIATRLRQALG